MLCCQDSAAGSACANSNNSQDDPTRRRTETSSRQLGIIVSVRLTSLDPAIRIDGWLCQSRALTGAVVADDGHSH